MVKIYDKEGFKLNLIRFGWSSEEDLDVVSSNAETLTNTIANTLEQNNKMLNGAAVAVLLELLFMIFKSWGIGFTAFVVTVIFISLMHLATNARIRKMLEAVGITDEDNEYVMNFDYVNLDVAEEMEREKPLRAAEYEQLEEEYARLKQEIEAAKKG